MTEMGAPCRPQGYLRFYAAITQSDNPRNPHGLRHAWAYLARYDQAPLWVGPATLLPGYTIPGSGAC